MNEILLRYLNEEFIYPIRDPLWKHIYLSLGMKQIVETPEFQKLGRIKQLGPASLVYPGATHTRLSHSLGVFFLGKQIIKALLNSENSPYLSLEGVKAFLAACLLHDLGHFPYAHSLSGLNLLDHEELSSIIIKGSKIKNILQEEIGCDPFFCQAIIDKKLSIETLSKSQKNELIFFRNILSGVLDPDKLDYLNRDAYFCGVPYGVQDIDFVMSQIIPTPQGLGMTEKGITSIESVLFSKYLMYKTVYWHDNVKITTGLIKKALYLALKANLLNPQDLYNFDDEQFITKMLSFPKPIKSLVEAAQNPSQFAFISLKPFDPYNKKHSTLQKMENRIIQEQLLYKKLKLNPKETPFVLLDIPAKLSFEVDLPIISNQGSTPFTKSYSVFSAPVVKGFTDTLTQIGIIAPLSLKEKILKGFPLEL